jgi:hypothetical protein
MSLSVDVVVPPALVEATIAFVYDASEAAPDAEEEVLKVMLVLMKYFRPLASIKLIDPVAVVRGWKACVTGVSP